MAFCKGDKVKVSAKGIAAGVSAKTDGKVKYVACYLATIGGGQKCDKKTCTHTIKDHVWVEFDGKVYSYHHQEVEKIGAATQAIPDAAAFKAKAIEVADKIKKAEQAGTLGADNGKRCDIDWDNYNSRLPGDSRPRRTQRSLFEPDHIESDDQIDWDCYNGFKRGPLRKAGVDRKG